MAVMFFLGKSMGWLGQGSLCLREFRCPGFGDRPYVRAQGLKLAVGGKVELDGSEGNVLLPKARDVAVGIVIERDEIALNPVFKLPVIPGAATELVDVARCSHGCHRISPEIVKWLVGDVDVKQGLWIEGMGMDMLHQVPGNSGGSCPMGLSLGCDGKCDARDVLQGSLGGAGDGTRVEGADAGILAMVDAADDDIRRLVEHFQQSEFDTVGRISVDCMAEKTAIVIDSRGPESVAAGYGMADTAAVLGGSDDFDLAQWRQGFGKNMDSGRSNTVVVCQ